MSNFKAVQQAAGENVIMSGRIVEFKGEGVNPTSGKPWKKIVAQDMDGEKHNVTVRGRLPDASALNKPAQFTISTYNGTARDGSPYVGYSGFCDPLPDYSQTTQQVPAPARQPAPVAPQPRTAAPAQQWPSDGGKQPPAKAPDWDAKDERIVRQNTLNRAVELYIKIALKGIAKYEWPLPEKHKQSIKDLAEEFRNYVYNGPNSGDQFSKEYGLPTMEEEAAQDTQNQQHPY